MYVVFQYTNMEDLVTTENGSWLIATLNLGKTKLSAGINFGDLKKNCDLTNFCAF